MKLVGRSASFIAVNWPPHAGIFDHPPTLLQRTYLPALPVQSVWECLETPGGQGAIEFAIPRVYRSGGSVDTTGVASIGTALSAGIKYVDGYVFPCVR